MCAPPDYARATYTKILSPDANSQAGRLLKINLSNNNISVLRGSIQSEKLDYKIIKSNTNNTINIALGNQTLYKSTNGGNNWSAISSQSTPNAISLFDSSEDLSVLVACDGNLKNMYYSTDFGDTWTPISDLNALNTIWTHISIHKISPSTVTMVVGSAGSAMYLLAGSITNNTIAWTIQKTYTQSFNGSRNFGSIKHFSVTSFQETAILVSVEGSLYIKKRFTDNFILLDTVGSSDSFVIVSSFDLCYVKNGSTVRMSNYNTPIPSTFTENTDGKVKQILFNSSLNKYIAYAPVPRIETGGSRHTYNVFRTRNI
jgi:hypothetical protein